MGSVTKRLLAVMVVLLFVGLEPSAWAVGWAPGWAVPRPKISRPAVRGRNAARPGAGGRLSLSSLPTVQLPRPNRTRGINTIPDVPALRDTYGSGPTAAAMIFGYYDTHGYPNMYVGSANGGEFPLTNAPWGTGECPLAFSHMGVDGRMSRGHVDDYIGEVVYNPIYGDDRSTDPYLANGWAEHAWDCLGDLMGTNQDRFWDGYWLTWGSHGGGQQLIQDYATHYDITGNGIPVDANETAGSGAAGMRLFAQSRGYAVDRLFTQRTDCTGGFSFADYKAEIDAGRPVMLLFEVQRDPDYDVDGLGQCPNAVVGVGYDDSSSTVYFYDPWAGGTGSFVWGHDYGNERPNGVIVMRLQPVLQIALSINSDAPSTGNPDVTLSLSHGGGDAPTEVRLADDNSGVPGVWTEWEPWATSRPWTLPAGPNGSRVVWAQARRADLLSAPVCDTVYYGAVTAEWTVMVYLDADGDQEAAGLASLNALEAVGSDANVNIVVQMDRAGGYDTSNGDWTGCRRYLVTHDTDPSATNSTLVQDLGEVNMGDWGTLRDFISWGVGNYPASKYALVLWDHGVGWRTRQLQTKPAGIASLAGSVTVGGDGTSGGDYLTTKEWSAAISEAGTNLAMVGFDTGLSGMIEPAYELWKTGRCATMAASPAAQPAGGWPYDTILADLSASPAMDGLALAEAVVARYGQRYPNDTMSAYNLGAMPDVLSGVNDLVTQITTPEGWVAVRDARTTAQQYTNEYYRDLRGFVEIMRDHSAEASVQSAAATCATALDSLVPAFCAGSSYPNGRGLSVSFPETGLESGYAATNLAWVADAQWAQFLTTMGSATPPPVPLLHAVDNADSDRNYTVTWDPVTFAQGVGAYQVEEWTGGDVFRDDAETAAGWSMTGFTQSTARAHSGTHSYYSSPGNNVMVTDTSYLVSPFGTSILTYCTWYHLETWRNYAYVEVSGDGGSTWHQLAAYAGHGQSWTLQSHSLAAYAGQSIRIRFRCQRDPAMSPEGIYFDDIAIANLAPTGNSWTVPGTATSLDVTNRPNGTWAYTVRARSNLALWSGFSNTEVATVAAAEDWVDVHEPQGTGVAPQFPTIRVGFDRPMDQASTEAALSVHAAGSTTNLPGTWTWSDNEMSFRLQESLLPLTEYVVTVAGTAQSAEGPTLGGPYTWTFTTNNRPAIVTYLPSGTTVPCGSKISLTFNQAMNQTVTQEAFWLRVLDSGVNLPGSFVWVDNELQFTPTTPLTPATTYRIWCAGTAKTSAGIVMGTPFREEFTTTTRPEVLSYLPSGTEASCLAKIRLTFNQPMNHPVTQATFWLRVLDSGVNLPGTFGWVGNELQFTPTSPLTLATTYRIWCAGTAKAANGIVMGTPFRQEFTTTNRPEVLSYRPWGTDAPTNAKIRLAFNQPMNQTVTEAAFWLRVLDSGVNLPGTFAWVGNELQFTPSSPLLPATTYRIWCAGTAKAASGVVMGTAFRKEFTTGAVGTMPAMLTAVAAPTAQGAQVTVNLTAAADVALTVRNMAGRPVAVLPQGQLAAGTHTLLWNGLSTLGTKAPAGMYLVEVAANSSDGTKASVLAPLRLR